MPDDPRVPSPGFTAEVDRYQPHPMNARRSDLETIKDSLREFGQIKPVVVSAASGYVVAGNGTLAAIKSLGWAMCWWSLVHDLTPEDELRLLALDNRASDRGGYDKTRLLELLDTIADQRQGLTGTGWTDRDRARLAKLAESGTDRTTTLFRDLGATSEPGEPDEPDDSPPAGARTTVARVTVSVPREQADEIARWLTDLGERWGLLTKGRVVHEALRRAANETPS